MPALLDRPKLSNAMARALHQRIMRDRERRRQEEEEVDKMMEQKMREEEERKRKKEMEERMSLEETKEQISKMGGKLAGLQEEKHQLFLQLKKVLHEEEKRRRKEQSDMTALSSATYHINVPSHSAQATLLSLQGSLVSSAQAGAILGDHGKQLFQTSVIQGRYFQVQPGLGTGGSERRAFPSSRLAQGPHGAVLPWHGSPYAHSPAVPVGFTGASQLSGVSAFQAVPFVPPQQQQGSSVHRHFVSQSGFAEARPPANTPVHLLQHSADPVAKLTLPYIHSSRHASPGTFAQQSQAAAFQAPPQASSRHAFVPQSQAGQRFFHQLP